MIRVRKHERQLASGKVTTVRQHERNADVSAGQGGLRERPEDEWWDNPDVHQLRDGDPSGTWYFTEGDQLMAMHPDGTVHEVPADEETADEAAYRRDDGMFGPEDADPEWATGPGGDFIVHEDEPAPAGCTDVVDEMWDARSFISHDKLIPGSAMEADYFRFRAENNPSGGVGAGARGTPAHTQAVMKEQMRAWRARDVPLLPPAPMTPQMEALMGCDTSEGREKFERLRAYREAGYDGPLGRDGGIPDPDDPSSHESISALAYMRWQEESK